MYFDGVTNQNGSGIGVLLISPKGTHIPFFGRLNFTTTNNAIKYEACIMGYEQPKPWSERVEGIQRLSFDNISNLE